MLRLSFVARVGVAGWGVVAGCCSALLRWWCGVPPGLCCSCAFCVARLRAAFSAGCLRGCGLSLCVLAFFSGCRLSVFGARFRLSGGGVRCWVLLGVACCLLLLLAVACRRLLLAGLT